MGGKFQLGEIKTSAKVFERFWCPGVTVMIREHVRSCAHCQLHKRPSGTTRGLFHPVPPPRLPFDRVRIDHVGPFQLGKRGNRHLIVAIDYLTKWVEVRPVASTNSAAACRFVREDLVVRHGVPKTVVTDNGTAFTADFYRRMCDELGIRHGSRYPRLPSSERASRAP